MPSPAAAAAWVYAVSLLHSDGALSLCQRSVLHYAVHSLRLCEKLVAAKADVQRRDHQQNTPLHEACCHRGRTDVIAFLLEQRADINAANKCAQTNHNRV
jgi:ankyrin repeat protein